MKITLEIANGDWTDALSAAQSYLKEFSASERKPLGKGVGYSATGGVWYWAWGDKDHVHVRESAS